MIKPHHTNKAECFKHQFFSTSFSEETLIKLSYSFSGFFKDIISDNKLSNDYGIDEFNKLLDRLTEEYSNKEIYPSKKDIFNAFLKPLKEIKVIILGQDPYPDGSGIGYAFATNNKKTPASLRNMFSSIELDFKKESVCKNELTLFSWIDQGVLLLNTCLTVEKGKSGSHKNIGWKAFTNRVIDFLNEYNSKVFILMGNDAHQYEKHIGKQHLVVKSVHPSPLSAYRGCKATNGLNFYQSQVFWKANLYLKELGHQPIEW